jgi:hypothetical protein
VSVLVNRRGNAVPMIFDWSPVLVNRRGNAVPMIFDWSLAGGNQWACRNVAGIVKTQLSKVC